MNVCLGKRNSTRILNNLVAIKMRRQCANNEAKLVCPGELITSNSASAISVIREHASAPLPISMRDNDWVTLAHTSTHVFEGWLENTYRSSFGLC